MKAIEHIIMQRAFLHMPKGSVCVCVRARERVCVEKLGDWLRFNLVENATGHLVLSIEQMSSMAVQCGLI